MNESIIKCRTAQGFEIQAHVVRLSAYLVVFEVNDPTCVLQMTEVLAEFRIILNERAVYSGRAVVTALVSTGMVTVCEAALDNATFDLGELPPLDDARQLQAGFAQFNRRWGTSLKMGSDFKVLLADMSSYLSDLRLWFEAVEMRVCSAPPGDRSRLEHQVLDELRRPIISALNALFEKFEIVAANVEPDAKAGHRVYVRRQLHPLVLCAPFAHRTFHKPLGYAGDYEMVNMILRDPFEGGSLFAKALNAWFISQPPAEAHRNRVKHLTNRLVQETAGRAAQGGRARVFNLGCGPAGEVQKFLKEHDVCDHADLTLLDFNDETLAHATTVLNELKRLHHRSTGLNLVKKSVAQILKGRGKSRGTAPETKYDFVYCAGLFDYLSDPLCRQLMNIFYEKLAPGGLLVTTNVDCYNPIQQMLDYLLDWRLIYRTGKQLRALAPEGADPDRTLVHADLTSVNIYLEVRKPAL